MKWWWEFIGIFLSSRGISSRNVILKVVGCMKQVDQVLNRIIKLYKNIFPLNYQVLSQQIVNTIDTINPHLRPSTAASSGTLAPE